MEETIENKYNVQFRYFISGNFNQKINYYIVYRQPKFGNTFVVGLRVKAIRPAGGG